MRDYINKLHLAHAHKFQLEPSSDQCPEITASLSVTKSSLSAFDDAFYKKNYQNSTGPHDCGHATSEQWKRLRGLRDLLRPLSSARRPPNIHPRRYPSSTPSHGVCYLREASALDILTLPSSECLDCPSPLQLQARFRRSQNLHIASSSPSSSYHRVRCLKVPTARLNLRNLSTNNINLG